MIRILMANEMGGGWGHLLSLRPIAEEFLNLGCEVHLLCRDTKKAIDVFSGKNVAVGQFAPWPPRTTGFSLSYAQNIWRNGYWDAETFGAHLTWWSDKFRELRPRFVITDYAPTALLSALSLDIPRGAIGTGFTLPPAVTPMPCLHPWLKYSESALLNAENQVLATIRRHVPTVHSVADIFEGAERFLLVFPEMDHFEVRASEKYFGPILETYYPDELAWPDGSEKRVFIYLSAENRCLIDLINHLKKLELPAIGHIRDLPESERKALESPTLRLGKSLINLKKAAAECDIAVTQGGLHTSAKMLLSGTRLLICPEQLEQTLLAYRLKQRGLCEFVSCFSEPQTVKDKLETVASSAELEKNAAAFAAHYPGYNSKETVRGIVRTCLKAL